MSDLSWVERLGIILTTHLDADERGMGILDIGIEARERVVCEGSVHVVWALGLEVHCDDEEMKGGLINDVEIKL